MLILFGAVVFVFGLLIGSFLNVCIYRIPNNKSIATPPSSCPKCEARIKWYDLIPVLSYLALKGKCRNCGEKISPRYMFIELLTGVLFVACFAAFGISGQFLASIVLTAILITITFIDIDYQIIPDSIMIFGLVAGIAFMLLGFVPDMGMTLKERAIASLLGMLCGAGPLIIINLLTILFIKRAGIGGGDIKLMGVAGIFLGMQNILLALVLGVIAAGIFSVLLLRLKKQDETENKKDEEQNEGKLHEIPFGPYLAAATFVCMLYGQQILSWYLGFYQG